MTMSICLGILACVFLDTLVVIALSAVMIATSGAPNSAQMQNALARSIALERLVPVHVTVILPTQSTATQTGGVFASMGGEGQDAIGVQMVSIQRISATHFVIGS